MQSGLFTILIPLFFLYLLTITFQKKRVKEKGSVRAIISTCTIFKRKLR